METNIKELIKASEFALKNLKEVGIPLAEKYGHVTSMDVAMARLEEAIEKVKE